MSEFKEGDRVIVRGVVTDAPLKWWVRVRSNDGAIYATDPSCLEPEPFIPKAGDRVVSDDGTSGVVTGLWVEFEGDDGRMMMRKIDAVHPAPADPPDSAADLLAAVKKVASDLEHFRHARDYVSYERCAGSLKDAIAAYEEARP